MSSDADISTDSRNSKVSFWLSERMKLLYSGVVVLLVSLGSEWILKNHPAENSNVLTTFLYWLLDLASKHGQTFFVAILTMTAIAFVSTIVWNYVWEERVKSFFSSYIKQFETDLEQVKEDTTSLLKEHLGDTKKYLIENDLSMAISRSNPKQIIDNLRKIHVEAYGNHCKSDKGLYESVNRVISKYLKADVPHRSNHNQDITIEELPERKGFVKWTEDTSYELHTVAIDPDYKTPHDTETISHELTYSTTACYSNADDLKIEIFVDDELIVTTENNLNFDLDDDGTIKSLESKTPDIIEVSKIDDSSDEWVIKIHKLIAISEGKVRVKIHEESVLSDNYFVVRRDVPTCSSTVSITLPTEWTFDYLTIPPGQGWSVIESVSYRRKVYTTDWVLPGIALACAWSKGQN